MQLYIFHLFKVIQPQMNLSEAIKNYISAFLRGAASRPAGLPRYGWGPLQAAGGQATAVMLKT